MYNISVCLSPFAKDQCKASAYLPFDVDLEDKSGSNTAVMVRNVSMTPYGSAHFTGNSALTLYKYADMSLGNKLLISFKFKFDRWPDSLDHAGKQKILIRLLYFIPLV